MGHVTAQMVMEVFTHLDKTTTEKPTSKVVEYLDFKTIGNNRGSTGGQK